MVIYQHDQPPPAMNIEQAARGFAACGSEARLAVLRTLIRAGDAGLSVGQIQERCGLPASTLAHHLRCLAAGGLVDQERCGRTVVSRAAYRHIEALADYLLSECCADAMPSPVAKAARDALRSEQS